VLPPLLASVRALFTILTGPGHLREPFSWKAGDQATSHRMVRAGGWGEDAVGLLILSGPVAGGRPAAIGLQAWAPMRPMPSLSAGWVGA